MTVNANVRYVEWFDAATIKPTGNRFVIGWYPEHYGGMCMVVRLMGDGWWFEGDAIGLPQDATPSHWCEFPEGPGLCQEKSAPIAQHWRFARYRNGREMAEGIIVRATSEEEAREKAERIKRSEHQHSDELRLDPDYPRDL